ncbi:WG repeat-containing protein [bacterium]|nr:WG repeat-containing protein [bacterium]
MKKIVTFILFINIIVMPVFSSSIFSSGGKYGLKDNKGNIVLNAQFQTIEQFSYTPSKKVIIPMHAMDEVEVKKLDLYKAKKSNLWGVVNSNGHITHDFKYKNIEVDTNGDLIFTLTDGSVQYAHPLLNSAKAVRDTFVTVIGLPVTLIGAVMIPIEAVSKVGKK